MPELSVVIPTLARRDLLRRVLDRLAAQDAGVTTFEVIVAPDARESGPETVAIADDLRRRPYAGRMVRASAPGASAARNRGWRAAGARVVLFLGDDVLPSRALVREHLGDHDRRPEAEVGVLGRVRWARELRVTPFMRWLERGIQFDYEGITGPEAGWGRFYTANASVKRELLERVDGFDEERLPFLYEDLDLALRMSELGFRLLYNPRASAEHLHPSDLDSWRERVAILARSEREFVAKHPGQRPYFHELFTQAAAAPPVRGRAARVARFVPPWVPWLGPRAWGSLDIGFRQALAPDFLRAWDSAASG